MTRTTTTEIRWLIRRDMDEVMAIEKASFDHPWSEEEFLLCLKQRNCIGCVLEDEFFRVKGFIVYELNKSTLRILNLAVAPSDRRCGLGRQMIQRLVDKLTQQGRTRREAEVRESNLRAQLFLQACGFKAVRCLRKHYAETNEDAYLFRHRLKGTT